MSEHGREIRIEGTMRASNFLPDGRGKQFLGATIECTDGREWVISYDEQSPFHPFADHRVVAFGEPYVPGGQQIGGGRIAGHLRVSSLRLAEGMPGARIREVLAGRDLAGQFELATGTTGESLLSFVADSGDTFLVANDPAGAVVGPRVEVWAYPVQMAHSAPKTNPQYLWVICPFSIADLQVWRERRS